MREISKVLTIADLTTRWEMSRQSVHEKKKENDFPIPIQFVSNGRTALYLESDIEAYEEKNWWITSPDKRLHRLKFIRSLINR